MTQAKHSATMVCAGCGRTFSHVSHSHIVRCEALREAGITSTKQYRERFGLTVPQWFVDRAKSVIEQFNATIPRETRIENSKNGFAVAIGRHPDLCVRGGQAGSRGLWARDGQKDRHRERIQRQNAAGSMRQDPNKLERKFWEMIGRDRIEFASFSFWKTIVRDRGIDHITPDFRVPGTMRMIEVYGDYWHIGENPQDRIDLWRSVGCECLVVWEHEINANDEAMRRRVEEYISGTLHECPAPTIDQVG